MSWHDRSLAPERLWDRFYERLLGALRSDGAWFGTAHEVVEWFRLRRTVTFGHIEVEPSRLSIELGGTDARAADAGLVIRVHFANGNETTVVDVPWHGQSRLNVPADDGCEAGGGRDVSARILMIAFTNYPGDTRVRREAEALVARGNAVDVICPWTPSLGDQRSLEGVRIHPTGKLEQKGELSPLAYIARDVAFLVRADVRRSRLHRRNRYDVVQVHTMPDYLVAAATFPKLMGGEGSARRARPRPRALCGEVRRRRKQPVIKLMKFVERRCVGFADHALAVHRPHLDALVRHGNPERQVQHRHERARPTILRATVGVAICHRIGSCCSTTARSPAGTVWRTRFAPSSTREAHVRRHSPRDRR